MIYGYIRVSTDMQDAENQKIGINSLAEKRGEMVQKWITDDAVSGTVDYKRRALGKTIKKLKKGDILLISELSRLARNMYMLFEILKYLTENEIQLYSEKEGFSLDGSIQSKVYAFGLGLAAEIERDMISKRTKEGLEARRRAGVVLGRPIGSKSKKKKLDKFGQQIIEYLKKGLSYAAIARMTGTHRLTVSDYVAQNDLEKHKSFYNWSDERKKKLAATIKNNPKHTAFMVQNIKIENDEIVRLYKENNHSLISLASALGISTASGGTIRNFLKKRNMWDTIVQVNQEQRLAVPAIWNSGEQRRRKKI